MRYSNHVSSTDEYAKYAKYAKYFTLSVIAATYISGCGYTKRDLLRDGVFQGTNILLEKNSPRGTKFRVGPKTPVGEAYKLFKIYQLMKK